MIPTQEKIGPFHGEAIGHDALGAISLLYFNLSRFQVRSPVPQGWKTSFPLAVLVSFAAVSSRNDKSSLPATTM